MIHKYNFREALAESSNVHHWLFII